MQTMIYKCLFMSKQNKKYSLCPNLLVILGVHTGIMSEKDGCTENKVEIEIKMYWEKRKVSNDK
jgi:hypothetical protein